MPNQPERNLLMDNTEFKKIPGLFIDATCDTLNLMCEKNVPEMVAVVDRCLETHQQEGRFLFMGTGANAANAIHFAADLKKRPTWNLGSSVLPVSTMDLGANLAAMLMWGNDSGFKDIFHHELVSAKVGKNDTIFAYAANGSQESIIKAVMLARERNAAVIAVTGFDGGELAKIAHINITVPPQFFSAQMRDEEGAIRGATVTVTDIFMHSVIESMREGIKKNHDYQNVIPQVMRATVEALRSIKIDNNTQMVAIVNRFFETYVKDGRFILWGNGGSAANSTRFAAELTMRPIWELGTHNMIPVSALDLTANMTAMYMWADESGFEKVFRNQLESHKVRENDTVVAFSGSGNSPNVLKAVELAQKRGASVVGMTAFTGGKLAKMADLSITVPPQFHRELLTDDDGAVMGAAEAIHGVLMQAMTESLREAIKANVHG